MLFKAVAGQSPEPGHRRPQAGGNKAGSVRGLRVSMSAPSEDVLPLGHRGQTLNSCTCLSTPSWDVGLAAWLGPGAGTQRETSLLFALALFCPGILEMDFDKHSEGC